MSPLTHSPLAANRTTDGHGAAAGQGGGLAGLLWLTWRQHRWALVGSVVLAAVLTGWMAYLSADMTSLYHQCHDTMCASGTAQDVKLSAAFGPVRVSNYLMQCIQFLPLLIGVFLGVPLLAREHEQRTLLLAWSQDVSPTRWLWTKLALLGAVVAALMAVVAAECDHLVHVQNNVSVGGLFVSFPFLDSGMLPLALGVAWFAVGVALGAATRRVLPAAITAVAGFVALLVVVLWRYPTLMTPLSRFLPVAGRGLGPDDLKITGGLAIGPGSNQNLFDSSGHALDYAGLSKLCPDTGPDALPSCMARNHLQTFVRYQPGSRIPDFHLIVAAGYLGIGVVALVAVWLVVRRTSLSAG